MDEKFAVLPQPTILCGYLGWEGGNRIFDLTPHRYAVVGIEAKKADAQSKSPAPSAPQDYRGEK